MTSPLFCSRYNNFLLPLILFCSLICCNALRKGSAFGFSFDGFGENVSFDSEITVHGDAVISGSVVRLTRPSKSSSGLMIYRKPVRFWGTKPGFSAYFSFSVSAGNGGRLSFFLLPTSIQLESRAIESNSISVQLIHLNDVTTVNGSENLTVISVGRHSMRKRFNLSAPELVVLSDGDRLHSWIDYDGSLKRIEMRFSRRKDSRPTNSSASLPIDLSNILWGEAMLVGLSSSNGNYNQSCTVYSWSFRVSHGAPYRMHSEPLDPNAFFVRSHESSPLHLNRSNYFWRTVMAMFFAAACGALFASFVMFLWFKLSAWLPKSPAECSVHPVDFVDEKIVLVEGKDADCGAK